MRGPQDSEEYLVVRERVPSSTEMPSVIEPNTNGNHSPIVKFQNNFPGTNRQEIQLSMVNIHPEVTEYQYVVSPGGS